MIGEKESQISAALFIFAKPQVLSELAVGEINKKKTAEKSAVWVIIY